MKLQKRGFALIELLVVVLIIGILAAVALPQYQKAVAKARLTEAVLFMNDMQKVVDAYLLQNGIQDVDFQTHPEILDVDLSTAINKLCASQADEHPFVCRFQCSEAWENDPAECAIELNAAKADSADLALKYQNGKWTKTCTPLPNNPLSESLCSTLQPVGWN